jgi:hypothetical protein
MKPVEDYSYPELLKGLDRIKRKFPAVYKWFFLWELEKANDSRQSDSGLGQE